MAAAIGDDDDEIPKPGEEEASGAPSAAARARAERNRLRARALREARLAARAAPAPAPALDPGGGFLPELAAPPPPRAAPPPAPLHDPADRPFCDSCGRPFAHSYLFDTFEFPACDACRDDAGAHELIPRSDAKAEYLLQDCDLDQRGGPLRALRRRNPHAARGEMRLYLRAQVEARALLVWGSEEALEAERARRREARARARGTRERRRLRALRLAVRSSVFEAGHAAHVHEFGAETYDAAADVYARACACGHTETYEKM